MRYGAVTTKAAQKHLRHSFTGSFITLRPLGLEHRHTRRILCLENTVAEKSVTNVGIDKMNVSRD